MEPSFLSFPKNITFGTSIAPFQVEGNSGNRRSDWDTFLQNHPDIISPNQIGPQWWIEGKAEADIDRLAELGMQVQRLGIEWARIEPEQGSIDKASVKRYRQIIDYLKKKNIKPLVTLNHYTLPAWIAQKGSWDNPEIVSAFTNYTKQIASEFGDVTEWLTLNEPGVLIESGYLLPFFPPQHVGIFSALRARANMIRAHKSAYAVLKKEIAHTSVSMAFAFRWYRPANQHDYIEKQYANITNYLDNLNYVEAVKDSLDYIGVNFYAGYYLNLDFRKIKLQIQLPRSGAPKTILFGEVRKPGAYVSDLGAPIVPDFFLDLLRTLHQKFHKPIVITENGIADKHDRDRAFYLLTHLVAIWKAMEEGISVPKYCVWSSIDNIEWLQGYRQHFGLIGLDPVTGVRTVRESAHMYKEIINSQGIDYYTLLSKYLRVAQQDDAKKLIAKLLKS